MPFTLQGLLQGQKEQNELKILLQVWVIITKAQGQEEKWNLCWSCHRGLFYRLWVPRRQRLPLFHFLFIEHSTSVDAGERARLTVLKKRRHLLCALIQPMAWNTIHMMLPYFSCPVSSLTFRPRWPCPSSVSKSQLGLYLSHLRDTPLLAWSN